jgi:hypothetical protein
VSLTLKSSASTVALGGTLTLTATVAGTSDTTLTWSVNGVKNGNSTTGTLTGSGLTRTYKAPSIDCPSPNPVTFEIVSAADTAVTKTTTATVTDKIAVTLTPATKSLALGGTQVFTATISNTTDTTLNWYVNGAPNGSAAQGLLTGTGLTRTYKAPSIDVPNPNPAIIKVASAADPSKYKTASVTVTDSIAVTLTPASKSLAVGGKQVFTATITGTTNAALNWYVNGVQNGSAAQGLLTGTGLTRTYTAPSVDVPSPNPAAIEVASAADPAKNKTARVTVTDSIAVTLTPASKSLAVGGKQVFTATITGTTNTALNWYVNGVQNGNTTQGTLTGTGLTRTYTAPAAPPSPNPVVIKVASAADPSKYKTASVTVSASIAVTLSPSSASVALSGTQVFTATITGTTDTALNWYVNGVANGNATQGALTACTTVAPFTCKYTAPSASVPSPNPAAIKVASAADPSVSKTSNVTVTTSIVVSFVSPTAPQTVVEGHTLALTASLTGSTDTAVTWSVNGVTNGNSTYGTIPGSSLTATYTAPATVPSPATFNIKVASQADPSKSATLSVTISATAPTNVVPVSVNLGPNGNYFNGIFTTVKVCQPGTTTCVAVPNVLVDTGSFGLRVLSSALTGLSLAQPNDGSGDYLFECSEFGDLEYTFGPVALATVQLGGETASQVPTAAGGTAGTGIPIQVINEGENGIAPTYVYDVLGNYVIDPCLNTSIGSYNSVAALGSNGILGIGNYPQDCGGGCTTDTGVENVPVYPYILCNTSYCYESPVPLQYQVWNPVAAFSSADINGEVVQLPPVHPGGDATAQGTITFGIGTQSNNALGAATVYELDDYGNFPTAVFYGVDYSSAAFIDSGSNALYVSDAATLTSLSSKTGVTSVVDCSDNGFYCPSSTLNLSLTLEGYNSTSTQVGLSIENADTLIGSGNAALDDLGSDSGTSPATDYFDLGLPFFYGRSIFVNIAGTDSKYPNGFWAF